MKTCLYEVIWVDEYFVKYNKVIPTGRWRIRSGPSINGCIMDVQVKGPFFNRWISEYQLHVGQEECCVEFNCKDK